MQELYYTGNTTKLYLKAIYITCRKSCNIQSSFKFDMHAVIKKKGILSQLINKQTINFRMRHNREKVKIC